MVCNCNIFNVSVMLMRIPGQHYENVRSPSSVSILAKEGLVSKYKFIETNSGIYCSNALLIKFINICYISFSKKQPTIDISGWLYF